MIPFTANIVPLGSFLPLALRRAAQWLAIGLAIMVTSLLWIPVRIEAILGHEAWFKFGAEFLSLVPGVPGVILRRGFYRMTLCEFAINSSLGFGTTVSHRQTS